MRKIYLMMTVLVLLAVVPAQAEDAGGGQPVSAAKHEIAYPSGYDILSSGASGYQYAGDHFVSPYFAHPDYYNMDSTETLTIIPKFATYQQTTEYTCGAASAVMVLNEYGVSAYDEMTIARLSGTSEEDGVDVAGLAKFFKGIGWKVESSLDQGILEGGCTFSDMDKFSGWVKENLAAGHPIMVNWTDWGGHWQVIIGYDTMGTADFPGDDVMILADPYDTSDHWQDGYYVFSAERFFYMWREGAGDLEQPWLVAAPNK